MQRMFIVVREPEKTFGEDDRAMPFKHVRLTTLVTPDIADPDPSSPTARSFWVEVKTGPSLTRKAARALRSTGSARTSTGTRDRLHAPDDVRVAERAGRRAQEVHDKYNEAADMGQLEERELRIPGQQLAFAKSDADPAKRNSVLVTESLNFVLDENGDPKLLMADVRIPQVEELLGTSAATTIRLYDEYVKNDLDGATGVFAQIAKPKLPMTDADRARRYGRRHARRRVPAPIRPVALPRPNLGVSTLTRSLGPLAGDAEDAVVDKFDPAKFFAGGIAQLFGTFDLAQLLLGHSRHERPEAADDTPSGDVVVTTLDWEPDIQGKDLVVAEFVPGPSKKLKVSGLITKKVASTEPPTFDFTGTLDDFRVGVLKSVFVNFVRFEFTKKSGQKPDVTVQLDPAQPIEFAGDLEFVEELRKAIPPDLFGDGPSLDITSTGCERGSRSPCRRSPSASSR